MAELKNTLPSHSPDSGVLARNRDMAFHVKTQIVTITSVREGGYNG